MQHNIQQLNLFSLAAGLLLAAPGRLALAETPSSITGQVSVQEFGGAPVGLQILLLDFETNDVGIPIAPLNVIDWHSETSASGVP